VIHCAIAPYSDEELLEIGLLENIMQGDLDPLEEAFALRTLVEQRSYTPHQLAERIGKDVAYVTQRLQMVGIVVEERADTAASVPDSARSNRPVPDTSEITRHVIRGDIQTLRTIFARWNEVLRHGGDERAIILGYLEELVAEARRLERWR
jgi:ParB family chromosome partitioning protein